MGHDMSAAADNDKISSKGGAWIGIDLGTTNCTAACYDISRSRCKVLRLGYKDLARPPSNGSSKEGKIVPSVVLFTNNDSVSCGDNHNVINTSDSQTCNEQPSLVGYAAMKAAANDDNNESDGEHTESSGTLVTSFKRVVGMTSRQAIELRDSDPSFGGSLPFNAVIIDDESFSNMNEKESKQHTKTKDVSLSDVLGGNTTSTNGNEKLQQQSKQENELQEGVGIQISAECLMSPLQVTTILLQSIRIAASDYLINNNRSKIKAPGLQEEGDGIQNCVIGVPAHYSHAQRSAIQNAAKNAGFTGQVNVMTESTAATMAYGHFVSPNIPRDRENTESGGKNILVFDMGGGTTDCTITNIDFKDDNVQFHVVATSGDSCLGGDDVDELVARYVWKEHNSPSQATSTTNWKASEHQDLISACRCAKEELCGNDNKNQDSGVAETQITLHDGRTIKITRNEFDLAIQQLIDRAEQVVDEALSVLVDSNQQKQSTEIHEVVLVGGSTHISTIRSMLSRRFPPPLELCTSLNPETAVGQGLAIQAALLSKTVPLYELRNAMMLDVLPHSIGVWVQHEKNKVEVPFTKGQIIQSSNENQSHYIEILQKDSPLPSKGSQTFTLANINQTGVTVIAAECIGPGDTYQCMGVFDFLLCRLHDKENDCKTRQVKIGMSLDANGQFTVSIFDERDPAHREKRRRYLNEKANGRTSGEFTNHLYDDEDDKRLSCSGTEIALYLFCIVFFALYVAARVAFSDMNTMEINEL